MKIVTPEEEAAHNAETWKGGIFGSVGGAAIGAAGVYAASVRFPAFRQLSVPFRAFLVTASTSFGGVVTADRYSRAFEKARDQFSDFENVSEREQKELASQKGAWDRTKSWVSEQRYPLVFGSWVASMGAAMAIVGRNRYLTTQQKLVQARVYAQGLTLAVLIASFALEGNDLRAGKGRWETVKVIDPTDPEHKRLIEKRIHHERYAGEDQWMDMIAAQEEKVKARGHKVRTAGGSRAGAGPKDGSEGEVRAAEEREKKQEEEEKKKEEEAKKKEEAEKRKAKKSNGDKKSDKGDKEEKKDKKSEDDEEGDKDEKNEKSKKKEDK